MWNSWSLPPLSVPWPGQASAVVWAAPAVSGSPGQAGPQHSSSDHNTQLMLLLLSFCIFTSVFIQCTKNNGDWLNKETRVSAVYLSWRNSQLVEAVGGLCEHQIASGCYQNSPCFPSLFLITSVINQLCVSLITKRIKYHWVITKISLGPLCIVVLITDDINMADCGQLSPAPEPARASKRQL